MCYGCAQERIKQTVYQIVSGQEQWTYDADSVKAVIYALHPAAAAIDRVAQMERVNSLRTEVTVTEQQKQSKMMAQLMLRMDDIRDQLNPEKEQRRSKMVKTYRTHLVNDNDELRAPLPTHKQARAQAAAASKSKAAAEQARRAATTTSPAERPQQQRGWQRHQEPVRTSSAPLPPADSDMSDADLTDGEGNQYNENWEAEDGAEDNEDLDDDQANGKEEAPSPRPARRATPTPLTAPKRHADVLGDISNTTGVLGGPSRSRSGNGAFTTPQKPITSEAEAIISDQRRAAQAARTGGVTTNAPLSPMQEAPGATNDVLNASDVGDMDTGAVTVPTRSTSALALASAAPVAATNDNNSTPDRKRGGRPPGTQDARPRKRTSAKRSTQLAAEEEEAEAQALMRLQEEAEASSAAGLLDRRAPAAPVERAEHNLPTTAAPGSKEAGLSDLYAELEDRQRNPSKRSKRAQQKENRAQYSKR